MLQGSGNYLVNYQPHVQPSYGPSYAQPSLGPSYPGMVWDPSQVQQNLQPNMQVPYYQVGQLVGYNQPQQPVQPSDQYRHLVLFRNLV